MSAQTKNCIYLFFLFALPLANNFCMAQQTALDPGIWVARLSEKSHASKQHIRTLVSTLEHVDSASTSQFLEALAQKGKSAGAHFHARFNCVKACSLVFKEVNSPSNPERKVVERNLIKAQVKNLFSSAMDFAYRSADDELIAVVSDLYAQYIIRFNELGLAVMYAKNSIDLYEKLSNPILPEQYQHLAELLYTVREYDESVRYGLKAVAGWKKSPDKAVAEKLLPNCINTIALGYHRQNKYDSAFLFYSEALQLSKDQKNRVWTGIVSGNMGQILYVQRKYDTAYRLFKIDYLASQEAGYYDNAANSLQWAARADLAQGRKNAALAEAREAFQLLDRSPNAGYLRNAYYTAAQVFREIGLYDSAFYYTNLWSALNDSLEKVVATSSISISMARLNEEASRYKMQTLQQEKRSQLLTRNLLIAFIVVLSVIALLVVNRKRLQEKLKTEKVEHERLRMAQEVASARTQLKMFTENIVEKTALIETLKVQAKGKESASEQQAIIEELGLQTILTEKDWTTFKLLFEKIHPAFFVKLKEKFPDITSAEQRMAALTRLHLNTKQVASMLGISVDSVHKSRQRLRQRFQVEGNEGLDEMVTNL